MKKVIIILSMILGILALSGETINVPEDYATIQTAINNSESGDTILVQPGTYNGMVNFGGRAITVTSLYASTLDESYIATTIINATNSQAVKFSSGETPEAILDGFTVTNGSGYYGAGIWIYQESSPTLRNLIVNDNHGDAGDSYGGGICIMQDSTPLLENLVVSNNSAQAGGGIWFHDNGHAVINKITAFGNTSAHGGALHISYSSPVITEGLFYDNESPFGGAVYVFNYAAPEFFNCTFANNTAEYGGAFYAGSLYSTPIITNSIVWGNLPDQIQYYYDIDITYSDVEGSVVFSWLGEGCIDSDPMFNSPQFNMYDLTVQSPCIDAGDPDSPYDEDGTIVDMGVFPFIVSDYGTISGIVTNDETGEPIEGAEVQIGANIQESDETGFYEFDNVVCALQVLEVRAENYISEDISVEILVDVATVQDFSLEVDYVTVESVSYEFEDSPEQQDYPNNTAPFGNSFEEFEWVQIEVEEMFVIDQLSMDLTWNSLDYPNEGSLKVISPAGTEASIFQATDEGPIETNIISHDFDGEESAGTWTIIIIDSYGDGGHQITNGSFILSKSVMMPVGGLAVEYHSDTEAIVTWNAPNPFERYIIAYKIFVDGVMIDNNDLTEQIVSNLELDTTYEIGVSVLYNGSESPIETVTYEHFVTSNNNDAQAITELRGNYPNPFNPTTTISFSTKENNVNTSLFIYNVKGQKVVSLVNEKLAPGAHNIMWNGENDRGEAVSSGIYYYQLKSGTYTKTKKMVLLK